MAKVVAARVVADVPGETVAFLVGVRINRPWKVHRWLPVFLAMGPMLRQLLADPELGLLGYHTWMSTRGPMVVQYWRSEEHLRRFATDPGLSHRPAWKRFYRQVGLSGDVGVWHETYRVVGGAHAAAYVNMPRFGLTATHAGA